MKKNILISVYDMEIGGVERSLINMLSCFDYERYNVDLLVFSHQGDLMDQLSNKITLLPENNMYKIFRKSMKQCLRDGQYRAVALRMWIKLVASLRAKHLKLHEGSGYIQLQLVSKYLSSMMPRLAKRYDLAISYAWPHDFILNRVMAEKKIAWIHTDYRNLGIDNVVDAAMWAKFDRIISISEACTEAFVEKYPSLEKKIRLIENITSPSIIHKLADQSYVDTLDDKAFKIVSVGRLSFVKGFDLAIQAMRLLKLKGYDDIKWYIIGFGGAENELRSQIAELGLAQSVLLLGKKNNPYPYMKACDLYVQPSRYEGKAVSVTEAQILGRAILITNYSTATSQVSHDVDGYITGLSAEGIAEGIEKLYRSKELRQRLSRTCTERRYENDEELDKLYGLVEEIS